MFGLDHICVCLCVCVLFPRCKIAGVLVLRICTFHSEAWKQLLHGSSIPFSSYFGLSLMIGSVHVSSVPMTAAAPQPPLSGPAKHFPFTTPPQQIFWLGLILP